MTAGSVLKHIPSDFLVRETMVVALTTRLDAEHQYLLLRKSGYTTIEAVRLIADTLSIEPQLVTYGGLKDEDGITEQLVAVPADVFWTRTGEDGWHLTDTEDRWLQLQHYGYGRTPLRIGALEGNGFRIVVRNLPAALADQLADLRKINLFFLNYYDTQRFGVPGGPKRTHFVGGALLNDDWDTALTELAGLRAPESPAARDWVGEPKEFFAQLDPRTTSFYLAAHASHRWNNELAQLVLHHSPDDGQLVRLDGLEYRYASAIDTVTKLLGCTAELPYTRYTYDSSLHQPVSRTSSRSTVVQTVISVSGHQPDERHPGAHQVQLSFLLPSGCYATAAVRQLLATVRTRKPDDAPSASGAELAIPE